MNLGPQRASVTHFAQFASAYCDLWKQDYFNLTNILLSPTFSMESRRMFPSPAADGTFQRAHFQSLTLQDVFVVQCVIEVNTLFVRSHHLISNPWMFTDVLWDHHQLLPNDAGSKWFLSMWNSRDFSNESWDYHKSNAIFTTIEQPWIYFVYIQMFPDVAGPLQSARMRQTFIFSLHNLNKPPSLMNKQTKPLFVLSSIKWVYCCFNILSILSKFQTVQNRENL